LISQVAQEEIDWIDKNFPGYEHSSVNAHQRGMANSIYSNVSQKAQVVLRGRDLQKSM
jgi:hypothetical protein